MNKSGLLALGVAFIALTGANAMAANLSDATILKDFNAVVDTNGSTSSEILGASIFGGNFTAKSSTDVYQGPAAGPPAGYGALTVYGSTSGDNINMGNGGSAYVAGNDGAKINFNGGGKYLKSAPAEGMAALWGSLTSLSTKLSKLVATSTPLFPSNNQPINNLAITAAPNASGVAVIDFTAAQLAEIRGYTLTVEKGVKTIVFNVFGAAAPKAPVVVNYNANFTNQTDADNTIWNFYNANTVNLNTEFVGTVLAVNANVINTNAIDGDLISKSWTGQGELHSDPFTGFLPSTVTSAPEPDTWALLLIGVGAMGLAMRRSKPKSMASAA